MLLGPAVQLADVYRQYADFVWKALQRLGLSPPELEDAFQDVFVVAHRKLAGFEGESQLSTWLFGICLRVVKEHQRRFARRREDDGPLPELIDLDTPEQQAQEHRAEERLASLLDTMNAEQRAVFVMFEIEGFSCVQIAKEMGLPVGTIYSRLHAARQHFLRGCASETPVRSAGTRRVGGRTP